ncbi:MAG: phosphoglycerate dehydrogenase [Verrucomicrobia bacterium]|nr:phosphoglycerate dehydrogenase [Verrucomicrobiota bacterium]
MSRRILITPRSLTQGPNRDLEPLEKAGYKLVYAQAGRTPSEDDLLQLLPGCVGWLAGVEPISERVLRSATELKVISRNGTGVDNVPIDLTDRLGIKVLRAEGTNARGVAELAICFALASLRHLPTLHLGLKQGHWNLLRGREILDRQFGLVGCGAVGRLVAQMALGLGAKVTAFDPYPDSSFQPGANFVWGTLNVVLTTAEILSLHCPPSPSGRPVIDREALGQIKSGCCLINTARGSLVDEDAIIQALDAGKLSTYATDVFTTEPPDPASPLLRDKRVIVSPHIGAFTDESVQRATQRAVENLIDALT